MAARSLIFILLVACSGPQPKVEHATASPSPVPGATRVAMDIVNSGGEGTVAIHVELRDARRIIRAERTLAVQGKQTIHFETDVETPPGEYRVAASAQYPD
ncbi:MAG TPA: hypothetical protein VMZ53_14300 [Kofleriaceae bacterium]|nr:hypothetical protein [Kofleriaceae bacterium]